MTFCRFDLYICSFFQVCCTCVSVCVCVCVCVFLWEREGLWLAHVLFWQIINILWIDIIFQAEAACARKCSSIHEVSAHARDRYNAWCKKKNDFVVDVDIDDLRTLHACADTTCACTRPPVFVYILIYVRTRQAPGARASFETKKRPSMSRTLTPYASRSTDFKCNSTIAIARSFYFRSCNCNRSRHIYQY